MSWDERRLQKARLLLPSLPGNRAGRWADIGCGDGVFTQLLCQQLYAGSELYGVDRNQSALMRLRQMVGDGCGHLRLQTVVADFRQPLDLPPLDGMLLANSLHFVRRKRAVLAQLIDRLGPNGVLILIEYNARFGNPAVPFPIKLKKAMALLGDLGMADVQVVCREPSSFMNELYTVVALQKE